METPSSWAGYSRSLPAFHGDATHQSPRFPGAWRFQHMWCLRRATLGTLVNGGLIIDGTEVSRGNRNVDCDHKFLDIYYNIYMYIFTYTLYIYIYDPQRLIRYMYIYRYMWYIYRYIHAVSWLFMWWLSKEIPEESWHGFLDPGICLMEHHHHHHHSYCHSHSYCEYLY